MVFVASPESGQPAHVRGVSAVPGVYFLGLPWLYTWGSGRFSGVARDAEYLAEHIEARLADAPVERHAAPTRRQSGRDASAQRIRDVR